MEFILKLICFLHIFAKHHQQNAYLNWNLNKAPNIFRYISTYVRQWGHLGDTHCWRWLTKAKVVKVSVLSQHSLL